jgi:hypothetical protein
MATLIKGLAHEKHIVVLIGNLIKVIFLIGCQIEHSVKRDKITKKVNSDGQGLIKLTTRRKKCIA